MQGLRRARTSHLPCFCCPRSRRGSAARCVHLPQGWCGSITSLRPGLRRQCRGAKQKLDLALGRAPSPASSPPPGCPPDSHIGRQPNMQSTRASTGGGPAHTVVRALGVRVHQPVAAPSPPAQCRSLTCPAPRSRPPVPLNYHPSSKDAGHHLQQVGAGKVGLPHAPGGPLSSCGCAGQCEASWWPHCHTLHGIPPLLSDGRLCPGPTRRRCCCTWVVARRCAAPAQSRRVAVRVMAAQVKPKIFVQRNVPAKELAVGGPGLPAQHSARAELVLRFSNCDPGTCWGGGERRGPCYLGGHLAMQTRRVCGGRLTLV